MYSVGGITLLDLVLVVWLGILSFFIWKNKKFLTSFLPTTNGKTSEISLLDKFKEVLAEVEELKKKTNISSQNIKGLTLAIIFFFTPPV